MDGSYYPHHHHQQAPYPPYGYPAQPPYQPPPPPPPPQAFYPPPPPSQWSPPIPGGFPPETTPPAVAPHPPAQHLGSSQQQPNYFYPHPPYPQSTYPAPADAQHIPFQPYGTHAHPPQVPSAPAPQNLPESSARDAPASPAEQPRYTPGYTPEVQQGLVDTLNSLHLDQHPQQYIGRSESKKSPGARSPTAKKTSRPRPAPLRPKDRPKGYKEPVVEDAPDSPSLPSLSPIPDDGPLLEENEEAVAEIERLREKFIAEQKALETPAAPSAPASEDSEVDDDLISEPPMIADRVRWRYAQSSKSSNVSTLTDTSKSSDSTSPTSSNSPPPVLERKRQPYANKHPSVPNSPLMFEDRKSQPYAHTHDSVPNSPLPCEERKRQPYEHSHSHQSVPNSPILLEKRDPQPYSINTSSANKSNMSDSPPITPTRPAATPKSALKNSVKRHKQRDSYPSLREELRGPKEPYPPPQREEHRNHRDGFPSPREERVHSGFPSPREERVHSGFPSPREERGHRDFPPPPREDTRSKRDSFPPPRDEGRSKRDSYPPPKDDHRGHHDPFSYLENFPHKSSSRPSTSSSAQSSPIGPSTALVKQAPHQTDDDFVDLRLLPVCPKKKPIENKEAYWFRLPSTPAFTICERCYEQHIYHSGFRDEFECVTLNPPTTTFCAFNSPRVLKQIWPDTTLTKHFEIFEDYAKERSRLKTCSFLSKTRRGTWYTIADSKDCDSGFIACQACFEDVIFPSQYKSKFAPVSATLEGRVFSCHVAPNPFIEKHFERDSISWPQILQQIKYRLHSVPQCPGDSVATDAHRRWWRCSESPALAICEACYCDGIFTSQFAGLFNSVSTQPARYCGMAAFRLWVVWQYAVDTDDWHVWVASLRHIFTPQCDGRGKNGGRWNHFKDRDLNGFDFCDRCANVYVRPLGFGAEIVKHNYPQHALTICDFNHENPRQMEILRKLGEAASWREFEVLKEWLRPRVGTQVCPGHKAVIGGIWWGDDEWRACEECWNVHVAPTPLADEVEFRAVTEDETDERRLLPWTCDFAYHEWRQLWMKANLMERGGYLWFRQAVGVGKALGELQEKRRRLQGTLESVRMDSGERRELERELSRILRREEEMMGNLRRMIDGQGRLTT